MGQSGVQVGSKRELFSYLKSFLLLERSFKQPQDIIAFNFISISFVYSINNYLGSKEKVTGDVLDKKKLHKP